MGLSFYQINNTQYDGQYKAISVALIPEFMGILRTEDTSWECPYAMSDGHGLVDAYLSGFKEDGIHVVIPCLYHLENFPKLINIGWGLVLVYLSS